MKTIETKMKTLAGKAKNTFFKMKEDAKSKINDVKGGTNTVEIIVLILIVVVVAAVIMLPAMKETIGMGFNAVKDKMSDIINFIG